MAKLEDYLKDVDGNLSSTRLFSMWTLRFFFFWTPISTLILLLFAVVLKEDSSLVSVLLVLAGYFVSISLLALIAAFVPKQLNKLAEIRKLIESIRNGKEFNK